MSDQALKAAWQYFRMIVGLVLILAFVYMMLTGTENPDVLPKLLTLLIGLLQVGSGFVNAKAAGSDGG